MSTSITTVRPVTLAPVAFAFDISPCAYAILAGLMTSAEVLKRVGAKKIAIFAYLVFDIEKLTDGIRFMHYLIQCIGMYLIQYTGNFFPNVALYNNSE